MPTVLQLRRGTTVQNNNFTGAAGELSFNTSNNTVRVHDGATLGGHELATVAHVTNSIANVIDSAPAVLDTLNELAAALGDDPGFYSNIASYSGVALNQANAAYDRANVAVTNAGAAFDKANTLVATVVGVSSTSISNTNILDGLKTVDGTSSGLDSDLLDGQDGSYYLDWTNTTNKPDPVITVTMTGDVTGTASATLADVTSNTITIATTIANNSVALGTDTTGAYVANLVAGTGVSITGLGDEGTTPTIAIGQDVSTTSDVTFRDLTITGNVVVTGGTFLANANVLVVEDPLVQYAYGNPGDTFDIGFIGHYNDSGTERHAGLFRDATDKVFKFFANTIVEPSGNVVDISEATFQLADVQARYFLGDGSGLNNLNASNVSTGTLSLSRLAANTISGKTLGNNLDSLTAGTGLSGTAYNGSSAQTWTLATSGVSAGSYGSAAIVPVYTVDTYGRITSASNVTIAISSSAVSGLATSATTDTTNATNITSGTLSLSRLAANTISGVTLGNNLSTLTMGVSGTGLSGSATYNGSGAATFTVTSNATNANTGSAIVARDSSGDFSAGTITATLNGTANVANFINVSDDTSTNATRYPIFANGTSSAVTEQVSSTKLTFNPSTGLLTSTDYNSSSDKRLKSNIKTVEDALDKVNSLRGVTFKWKEGGSDSIGLIAQEVQKVIPEVVTKDDNGYLGIRYTNIIGVLVEAIKEQQDQINTLKKQIEKLNG